MVATIQLRIDSNARIRIKRGNCRLSARCAGNRKQGEVNAMTMRLGKIIMGIGIGFMIFILGIGIGELPTPNTGDKMGARVIAPYAGESTSLPKAITEDDPGWDCRNQGNHICGVGAKGGYAPGCYKDGVMMIAWSNYATPSADYLWGWTNSPCY